MKEYILTEAESATVADLIAQDAKVRADIKRLEDDLKAINGAFQGIKIVIAQQQGLVENKTQSVRFSDDFKKLLVGD